MRRAFVFLDFDMLIRHFVMSGAFSKLEERYEVTYVVHTDSTSDKTPVNVEVDKLGLKRLVRFEVPRKRMGSWDKLYCITALSHQRGTNNYVHRRRQMADVRGWRRTRYYELLSLPGVFPFVRRKLRSDMGVFEPLRDFLKKERPDIVIHPSILAGYFVNELAQICPELDIPFILLMNSWDNPSTKAMTTSLPDKIVVWGPQTRRHAIEYMKMPPDRVLEFGAAQFDVYREPIAETEKDLRRSFGVPDGVPVILYAGVSKSVNETAHLLAIDAAIADGRIPPCHVIYRPHPWRGGLVDGEMNFFDAPLRHVTMDPFMADYYRRIVAQPDRTFDLADYRVTARLLRLVRGVISPLSTMLLEAVMHGIPVIMFYPGGEAESVAQTINLGLKLPHFSEFWGPEGVAVCTNADGLVQACRTMLTEHQSERVRAELQAHAANFVVMDGPSYAERLLTLADSLTSARRMSDAAADIEQDKRASL